MPRAVTFTSSNSKFLGEKKPQFIGQRDGEESSFLVIEIFQS